MKYNIFDLAKMSLTDILKLLNKQYDDIYDMSERYNSTFIQLMTYIHKINELGIDFTLSHSDFKEMEDKYRSMLYKLDNDNE